MLTRCFGLISVGSAAVALLAAHRCRTLRTQLMIIAGAVDHDERATVSYLETRRDQAFRPRRVERSGRSLG